MTGLVSSLWRHPIKSHGRESLDAVTLIAGQTMPGVRVCTNVIPRDDIRVMNAVTSL